MGIALIVTFAMIMLVAVGWFWTIRHRQVNAVASIVTIIGVLGTFFGIAIGLHQFDAYALKESVPKLLAGLKIAFWTSILGIAGSVWLKWSALNERKRQVDSEEAGPDTTVNDPVELLRNILAVQREEGQATRETLRSIEKSLTGEGDSTVLTQLQKLRTTFSDKQDDLIHAFNEFADQMAQNNTKALIKALEEVMRDFNAKINEQFGDNFRQLNEAVGKINEWQEQYRQQMDELAAQFQVAAASIEQSRQSLEIIAERSESIVSSSERLNPILQALQHQIQQLNNHLTAFSALADNARDAFPIIEDRLNQLTNDFSTIIKETIDNSHTSMQSQREALTNQSQQLESTVENTSRYIQEQTEDIFEQTTIRIEEVIDGTFQGLKDSLASQSQQLQSIVTETNQGLENTLQTQSGQLQTMVENTSGQLQKLTDDFSAVVKETIDDSHASMQSQRENLAAQSEKLQSIVVATNQGLENTLQTQSEQLQTMVENTSRHIQQQTEGIFQYATTRIEPLIDSTFQGLKNFVENQSEKLQSIVVATNQGLENTLQTQSGRLQTMVENTNRQLEKLTNDFSTIVQETIDNSHTSMQTQQETLNDFSKVVRESVDNSHADMIRQREALENFTGRIEGVIRSTHQGLENTLEETNRGLENTLQAQSRQLSTETERIFRESGERMTQQIQLLDTALQEELTKALESLGSQLTSLSRRFVDDYSPLTEKLRDVVEIAESLPQTLRYQERQ